LRARLESLAAKRGVATRIHWPGMLTGDAKWGAFRAAEFFVLPSHQENFGIVVAEAMASSRPVLITDKVNIWREIEADDAGIVVSDDAAAIESGLRRLCSMTRKEREAMGERARKSFLARYDIENNATSLLATIQNVTQGATEQQASCGRHEDTRCPSR
ncbi:glycosyltransferase, partial [Methylosinus sp. R-45379]|uniref:glycosyltransferase n=1 Tax=Methylosinus sp. R-45379 TaxID=980563 RepID=UPI0012ED94D2